MAKIENTFEAICDFMARDQFLNRVVECYMSI